MGFIYKITSPSNKMYVGQTKKKVPQKRWIGHCYPSQTGCVAIKRAIDKYGAENMTFETIEECSNNLLNDREEHWIRELDTLAPNGYNLRSGGGVGETVSEESKSKMSATRRKKSIDKKGYIGHLAVTRGSFRATGVDGLHLGTFSTREEAEATLCKYTRDPKNFIPILSNKRKCGEGSVYKRSVTNKWCARIMQNGKRKGLGHSYATRKEAEDAIEEYFRTPEKFPETRQFRKIGTGSIRKRKGRWEAAYKRKYIGRFDTVAQAEAAILAHKEKILRAEGKKPLKE